MSPIDEKRARNRWSFAVIGMLSFPLVLLAAAVRGTAGDPALSVERDYERRAENYGEVLAAREHARTLGWSIAFAGEQGRLSARLTDRAGHPLPAAHIEVECFALARPDHVESTTFAPQLDGSYASTLRILRSGIHKLRGTVSSGGEAMSFEARVWLEGAERPGDATAR